MCAWTHYSRDSALVLRPPEEVSCAFRNKPNGLYFAKGTAWREWCHRNEYPCGDHEFVLNTPVQALKLINQDQVRAYECAVPGTMVLSAVCFNWNAMRKDGYQGFLLERKSWDDDDPCLDVPQTELWHWDFDVDTLVIWDTDAIRVSRVVRPEPLLAPLPLPTGPTAPPTSATTPPTPPSDAAAFHNGDDDDGLPDTLRMALDSIAKHNHQGSSTPPEHEDIIELANAVHVAESHTDGPNCSRQTVRTAKERLGRWLSCKAVQWLDLLRVHEGQAPCVLRADEEVAALQSAAELVGLHSHNDVFVLLRAVRRECKLQTRLAELKQQAQAQSHQHSALPSLAMWESQQEAQAVSTVRTVPTVPTASRGPASPVTAQNTVAQGGYVADAIHCAPPLPAPFGTAQNHVT